MTTQSTATDRGTRPISAPDAVTPLPDGRVIMWLCGRYAPVSRALAVSELAHLIGSPIPASQVRAEAIRAALKETMQ